jgi:hypothetical protein
MDGVYECVVAGVNQNGQFAENVFHFQVTGSSGDEYATAIDLCNSFSGTSFAGLLSCMGSAATINILYAKKVDGLGGASIYVPIHMGGAITGAILSNAMAIDIAWYPGGALNRAGRTYVWGVPAAQVVGDVIQTALVTAANAFIAQIITPLVLSAGTAVFGTFTRKTKAFTPATHGNLRPKLTGLNKRTVPLY